MSAISCGVEHGKSVAWLAQTLRSNLLEPLGSYISEYERPGLQGIHKQVLSVASIAPSLASACKSLRGAGGDSVAVDLVRDELQELLQWYVKERGTKATYQPLEVHTRKAVELRVLAGRVHTALDRRFRPAERRTKTHVALLGVLSDLRALEFNPDDHARQSHIEQARELQACGLDLAMRCEAGHPLVHGDDATYGNALGYAWMRFIAFGSGHCMYHDLPASRAQKSEIARKNRGQARDLTVDRVVAYMKAHRLVKMSDEDIEAFLDEYEAEADCRPSVRTVRNRIKEARDPGKLPSVK